jgi:hypothetical protein
LDTYKLKLENKPMNVSTTNNNESRNSLPSPTAINLRESMRVELWVRVTQSGLMHMMQRGSESPAQCYEAKRRGLDQKYQAPMNLSPKLYHLYIFIRLEHLWVSSI